MTISKRDGFEVESKADTGLQCVSTVYQKVQGYRSVVGRWLPIPHTGVRFVVPLPVTAL